jgi:hypothetical protein
MTDLQEHAAGPDAGALRGSIADAFPGWQGSLARGVAVTAPDR